MKKKPFIAIVVLLMCCNQIQCQETKKESKLIHLLQIESDCIYPPLDRAISLFDNIESKNDTLLFFIDIVKRPQDSIYMLQIEYENNIDFCFNYFIPVYGYFYYQNCLFIVSGLDSEIIFSKKDIMTRLDFVTSATRYMAAKTLPISGCAPQKVWTLGRSSRPYSTVPTSSAPPVSALVPQARATSASPPSIVMRRPKRHSTVSRSGAKTDI